MGRSRLQKVKGLLRHKASRCSVYSTVPLTFCPFLRAWIVPITGSLLKSVLSLPLSHTHYTQEGRVHLTGAIPGLVGALPPVTPGLLQKACSALRERLYTAQHGKTLPLSD